MTRSLYTRDEVVLCTYAARYDGEEFGGVEAIHSPQGRSRDSIKMKISNIAFMLDDKGAHRQSSVSPLTGVPAGQGGRETNWDLVSRLVGLSREALLAECRRILEQRELLPGELPTGEGLREGAVRRVVVNAYERNPEARRRCIVGHGTTCAVCAFDFGERYGPVAQGFIHVHHLRALADIGEEYEVDPLNDLRPVCPNCHAVLHLRPPAYGIEEVRGFLRGASPNEGDSEG